jgi:hypothetical protein
VTYIKRSGIWTCSLPRISAARGKEIKDRCERYSIREAAKTAVLNEFDHISFHRQNWFSGMRVARAADTSWQLNKTGCTEARRAGTEKTASLWSASTWWFYLLESEGVECILLSNPTIVRAFLSSSATCSLIFYNKRRYFDANQTRKHKITSRSSTSRSSRRLIFSKSCGSIRVKTRQFTATSVIGLIVRD